MRKVDPKNKICIYLDQFAISDILENVNPLWIEIKKLLENSYSSGKIYCPLCNEHVLETVRKNFYSAKTHHDYLKSISDGYILKSEIKNSVGLKFITFPESLNHFWYSLLKLSSIDFFDAFSSSKKGIP